MVDQSENCICIDVRTTAQRLTKIYDLAMAPSGLTVTQFSQLHTINTLDAPNLIQLAAETGLDRSTLGRNIRLLSKMALVELRPGSDGRTKIIHLTTHGLNPYRKAGPLWKKVQTEMAEKLGQENLTALKSILAQLGSTPATQTQPNPLPKENR